MSDRDEDVRRALIGMAIIAVIMLCEVVYIYIFDNYAGVVGGRL